MSAYIRLLLSVIGPQRKALFRVFTLFILLSFIEAIGISLIVPFFSNLELGQSKVLEADSPFYHFTEILDALELDSPTRLFALIVVVFYIKAVLGYVTQRAIFKFGYQNQKRLIDVLVKKYQSMSVSEFMKQESSDLIQNLIGNVEIVSIGSIIASVRFVSELFIIIAITLVLIIAHPVVSLFMVLLIMVVILTYDNLFRKRIQTTGKVAAESRAKVIKNFQSIMQGFKEIHVIGNIDYFNCLIFEGTSQVKESAVEYKTLNTIPRYMMESMAVTGFALVFIIGTEFGLAEGEIIGIIGVFAFAALRLIPSTNQIASTLIQMRNSHYALEEVNKGLMMKPLVQVPVHASKKERSQSKVMLSDIKESIVFKDVCFSYETDSVLHNLNLEISHGSIVGLKGGSGTGKTTILDLLLGFFHPSKGKIEADGQNITLFGKQWHELFVYVPQDPFLFSGTIRENITLGLMRENEEELMYDAMQKAQVSDFVNGLTDGADTLLGERGVNLSGGQRQRIALARAFYLDRPVLILDEPTSALDRNTAGKLMDSLENLRSNKTIIITSHDLEWLERCDQVFELVDKSAIALKGNM